MFDRKNDSYNFDQDTIRGILEDKLNPLNRITGIVRDKSKVLDIGAGNGLLACVLREKHKDLIIDGIEPNTYAASIAKPYYRRFFCGFAQDYLKEIYAEDYDYIVLADVIEHLNDPLAFLQELCLNISNKTKVILSVPNVAFAAVRISLLHGQFDYVDSGILERTHLRFFTLKTLMNLIENIEMNVEQLLFLNRDPLSIEAVQNTNIFCLKQVLKDKLALTYQFLLVISKQKCNCEHVVLGNNVKNSLLRLILLKIRYTVLRGRK